MRRGSPSQGSEDQVKRAKMSGGNDSVDRTHALIMKVLQLEASQAPPSKLSIETVDGFLRTHLAQMRNLGDSLQFLAKAWRRTEEGGIVPSTWSGIPTMQEVLKAQALECFKGDADTKANTLVALLTGGGVPAKLTGALIESVAGEQVVVEKVLVALATPLQGRHLNDLRTAQHAALLRVLKVSKSFGVILCTSAGTKHIWRPEFSPGFEWKNKKGDVISKQAEGFTLQSRTLLGWTLSPSCFDAALIPPSMSGVTEKEACYNNVRRATRQSIDNMQRGTRQKLQSVWKESKELADILLRAGDASRCAVLEWIGGLLQGAEPRGKQGFVIPDGFNFWPQYGSHVVDVLGHNETPPFERSLPNLLALQAINARIHGFPTSGCAINTLMLLLELMEPIKVDQVATISPYFVHRSDVKQILGNWQKEARFGEEPQLEAAGEAAKADKLFTVDPGDKSLFKTELFWLTSKAISVCFLPVAKEAFHAMQQIASHFVDSAPETSDCAWREFLMGEAALKDPMLVGKLGHFVNLSFAFLNYHATAGGATFPPPEPGHTWHVLATVVLENLIDVCDIYRQRRSQGQGMPMDIFAHLNPGPVLNTLALIMASDNHVRDPSLRGKSVKLLHRLCFSFQSWQERLSQPPLLQHLIPCLVNVFVAVEKAIMSYYDLAYRYKYELRIPVMDLFALALQRDEHKKVLADLCKSNDKDRVLKLFTQLINDSNSQIEEALKALKDYREEKKKPPEPTSRPNTAGGNHDEEVLDDDRTGESGEDVYRRSRMNFKEHAKKYFGFGHRTWKQLWLLVKHCAPMVIEAKTILEQLLHSSLNAQLHYLVGPEAKNLKSGSAADYEEFGFNPKELVKQICEMLLFLAQVDQGDLIRVIGKDERFYSPQTFQKSVRFCQKYGLLSGKDQAAFDKFVKDLNQEVSSQRAAFDETEIPEHFLCEMMADIMSDPVMFPQSKKIVDRTNAERQIMGTDKDPYANTPLKIEELVPQPELKAEIHKFAKEKGIALEGGNMYD